MKTLSGLVFACFMLAGTLVVCAQSTQVKWKNVKVLVYTRNGKGYVHENIESSVKAIQKLGVEKGFTVVAGDDPSVFTEDNLKEFSFLLFANTNNDVFDTDEQRLAFRRYIESGGGFVGLHSVLGTERNWTWFKMMLGGTFVWHPRFQNYQLNVIDASHPTVRNMPKVWEKEDECYFIKEVYPGIKVTIAHDLETLDQDQKERIDASAAPFSKLYPAVWHQNFDGGYIWISALGHHQKDYEDPVFLRHVVQGMEYVASQIGKLDFSKAYATSRDAAVKY